MILHFCRLRPWRGVVCGIACCLILPIPWMGAERAYAAGWSIQRLDQPGISLGRLTAVSCSSKTACMAVGVVGTRALAERWEGSSWHVLNIPPRADSSSLAGVSCTSAVACVAVGSVVGHSPASAPLVARWNGSTWRLQPTPRLGRSRSATLTGVSCTSVSVCVAVGSVVGPRNRSLVERWNGSRWEIQPTPQPARSSGSSLQAVACVSARACTAVGGTMGGQLADGDTGGHAMALRWNGKSWKLQRPRSDPTLDATTLNGVSCPSANRCVAVGSADMTGYSGDAPPEHVVIERWDGSRWTVQKAKLVAGMSGEHGLDAVSCISPRACTAVGSAGLGAAPLVERFDGTRWTRQSDVAGSTTGGELGAVACRTAAVCVAVGGTFVGGVLNTSTTGRTLAERWTGNAWTLQQAAVTTSAAGTLYSVSCTSASACTAVGEFETDAGAVDPVGERWNGRGWSLEVPPDPPQVGSAPPSDGAELRSVSCIGNTFCMAVGNRMFGGYADDNAFAEVWDGASWALLPVPQPGILPVSLSSMSCRSATDCVAVGPVSDSGGNAIVERWNGTSWVVDGSLSSSAGLYAIACPSLNDCIAVGPGSLAEHWDGFNWTAHRFPHTTATAGAQYVGVSCGSATACLAVDDGYGLTAAWNGSSWKLNKQLVNHGIGFNAVSCASASSCVALTDEESTPPPATYRWDGSKWSPQAKFSAPARPRSVSCVAPLTCVAVGSYGSASGPFSMLAERYP